MTHIVCYNVNTETEKVNVRILRSKRKGDKKMTGNLEKRTNEEMRIVSENYNGSVYSMATVACGLLLCVGIIIYALLAC